MTQSVLQSNARKNKSGIGISYPFGDIDCVSQCLAFFGIKTKKIPLTQGYYTLVDEDDFDYLNQWKWHIRSYGGGRYYAARAILCVAKTGLRRRKVRGMAREICCLYEDDPRVVDHIDGNTLNNCSWNLRVCTQQENVWNRHPRVKTKVPSTYLGVRKRRDRWAAIITYNNNHYYLGSFDTETEAAIAYDRAASALFGKFAYINFEYF